MKYKLFLFLNLLLFFSCKKEAGDGGLATITGKVYAYDINTSGFKQDSAYIQDYKVYISYGDNKTLDDETRTSSNGEYTFKWLRKGTYTLRVFGYCPTCPLEQYSDSVQVVISKNRETINIRDLITYFK